MAQFVRRNGMIRLKTYLVFVSVGFALSACSESAPTQPKVEIEKRPPNNSEIIFTIGGPGLFRTYQAPLTTAVPIRLLDSDSLAVSRPNIGGKTGKLYFRDHSNSNPPSVHRMDLSTGEEETLYSKNFGILPTEAGDIIFEVSSTKIWLHQPPMHGFRFHPNGYLLEYNFLDSLITYIQIASPVLAGWATEDQIMAISAKVGETGLMWLSPEGEVLNSLKLVTKLKGFNESPSTLFGADFDPESGKIVFDIKFMSDPQDSGLFVFDLATQELERLTTAPADRFDILPKWGPDGTVYFIRTLNRNFDLGGDLVRLKADSGDISVLVGADRFPGSTGVDSFEILIK